MKVYFLRHGETTYNVEKRITETPSIDVHLTEKGRDQCMDVAKKLKDVKFDAIIISQLIRTKETAEFVNKYHNLPFIVDCEVNEIQTGFEGQIGKVWHDFLADEGDRLNAKQKGKESINDVVDRIEKFLNKLKGKDYENVLVVSHEVVLMAVDVIMNNQNRSEMFSHRFKNCEVIEFEL